MNDSVTQTWTALNGNLVFEITIVRARGPGRSSSALIFCRDNLANSHEVNVYEGRHSDFNYRFTSGCYVYGYLRQQAHVQVDGVGHIGIFADIRFGYIGRYDEQHFEGFMVTCETGREPPPDPPVPVPIDPVVPSPDLPIVSSAHGELFPYVYIRKWPAISTEAMLRCFIQYTESSGSSPPPSSFYGDLCSARTSGRLAMVDLALNFIDGAPPYQDEFVSNIDRLIGPVTHLPQVAWLVIEYENDPVKLIAEIQALFHASDAMDMHTVLTSPIYLGELDRVWQSYFALIIILGYDAVLLAQLIRILITAHLLNYLFVDPAEPDAMTSAVLRDLAAASIILPKAVFPLPPATFSPPCASPPVSDKGWIEPYAIGDLQMVRQRLLRYAPGEVAHIENIMRGEKKEIGRKRVHRQVDYQKNETSDADELNNESSDGRNNLLEETRRAIAEKTVTNTYDNFQTNYGPPTEATLNGSWTESIQQGTNPGADDITRFARDILNRTVSRITRNVNIVRGSSTLNESEETVKSTIDNTAGDRNLVCVFRWLNKVYEACVVNYGNRLMVEFMVRDPAADFIQEQQDLQPENIFRPASLSSQQISSFKSINTINYADLAAEYAVTDIVPPPAPRATVSATLRSGEEKLVAIPTGYVASDASVSFIEAPDGPTGPVVLVGSETFKPGDSPTTQRTFGEDTTMPISVVGYATTFSPPSDTDVLVNVVIVCKPSDTAMDAWRIRTYNAILTGYQKQMATYDSIGAVHRGRNGPSRSPQASQKIEREQLKRGCMRLLLERFSELTGYPDFVLANRHPDEFSVNEPRYIQFFDELFEWDEMTYRFYNNIASSGKKLSQDDIGMGENAPFTAFLKADMARVMLPARPSRIMALLYFLSTGMLWDGDNRLAPVSLDDAAIVNDLKTAGMQMVPHGHCVGRPWEVIVPTSMQVIDNGGPPQEFCTAGEL